MLFFQLSLEKKIYLCKLLLLDFVTETSNYLFVPKYYKQMLLAILYTYFKIITKVAVLKMDLKNWIILKFEEKIRNEVILSL